ncbi:hypothetical protein EVAR_67624_1 [Eumeta japonica]|uniref:PiggyBac transposable element-derived protein domain-containing protein n=1 Tax=Eumeta variegata TaxID=151549 RepID=A0A4C2A0N4_EUMVA|nr:hypothetical protein EVAR_67624_1 [Eumeta japonica]
MFLAADLAPEAPLEQINRKACGFNPFASRITDVKGGHESRRRTAPHLHIHESPRARAKSHRSIRNTGLIDEYHKTKWSTSLRSRHIVDLALSESDQSLRSPGPARIPSPAIPDRSSAQPSPSSSTSSPQFKRPKTVNVPDFNQPKNQAQADSEWGVSTDVEECTSGTKKLLMELGINKLGEAREILYVIEIEDTEHDIMSQVSNLVAPFPASTIQPASTHQVITFPDVHVSADEDMPSSSRTFRVSSPTEALLDPESGSSYDDSEFSDDDDAEYLVTSAKKKIQQNLSNDEELPPQVAASARFMEAEMDVDHEKLLSGDVNFKWQRDFTAFTAVREEFFVHPVGAVKDYDSPYDAFIDIFDVDIMKEIVIETNRYAHQVIDKAKAVVYIQCHRACTSGKIPL